MTYRGKRCSGRFDIALPKPEKIPLGGEQLLDPPLQLLGPSQYKRHLPVCSVETVSPQAYFELLSGSRTSRKVSSERDIQQTHRLIDRRRQSGQGAEKKGDYAEGHHPEPMVAIESHSPFSMDIDMIIGDLGHGLAPISTVLPGLPKVSKSHNI